MDEPLARARLLFWKLSSLRLAISLLGTGVALESIAFWFMMGKTVSFTTAAVTLFWGGTGLITGALARFAIPRGLAEYERCLLEYVRKPQHGTMYRNAVQALIETRNARYNRDRKPLDRAQKLLEATSANLDAKSAQLRGKRQKELGLATKKRKDACQATLSKLKTKLEQLENCHKQTVEDLEALIAQSEIMEADSALEGMETDDGSVIKSFEDLQQSVEQIHEFISTSEQLTEEARALIAESPTPPIALGRRRVFCIHTRTTPCY